MKKRKALGDMPIGKLTRLKDSLPSGDQLTERKTKGGIFRSIKSLFQKSPAVPCEFCSAQLPIDKRTKVFDIPINEGAAIILICGSCGRLQRPRILRGSHLDLADVTDKELQQLQKLYESEHKSD